MTPTREWEPDGDSDDCSEPEADADGNTFDAFRDGLMMETRLMHSMMA